MREAGISPAQIYTDKISGKNFDRPAYRRLVRKLGPGDTLFIKSIDRLGRNYDDIQEQWKYLTKTRQCDIVVIDMPLLDTRKDKDRTGIYISDLVIQVLSYVAETERNFLLSRQAEGIAAAKERGIRFGRPKKQPPENFPEVCKSSQNHEMSATKAAKLVSVSPKTFLNWVKNYKYE